MSRISGGSYQPTQQTREPVDEATPGHPIGGTPTVSAIPKPIAIIPFAPTVNGLPRHDEPEAPLILTIANPSASRTPSTVTTTTTTTTTTTATPERVGRKPQMQQRERTPSPMGGSTPLTAEPEEVEPVGPKPIQPNAEKQENEKREKMARAMSVHRVGRPVRTDGAPRKAEQPLEERSSESSSQSIDQEPTARPVLVDSSGFRRVTVSDRQKSRGILERRTSVYRDQRQLGRTAENPRTVQGECTPPPMENSAPAELANRRNSDPPEEWRKAWRHEVNNIKGSDWCGKVLAIIVRRADRVPNLDELKTSPRMRAAYRYGLSAAEAASIFLYTSAAFKEVNEPLREGNLDKLRPNRRNALKTVIANIDSGLMKLPEVKEPLVRVVRLKTNIGQNLQVDTEWREPAFGSCFRADKKNMKWDGNHELLIAVTSGARDVSALSDAPNEGEVLVERGRTYRIGKRTLEGSRVKLELSEVAQKRKST